MITTRIATESDYEFCRIVHHQAYREVVIEQFGEWNEEVQDQFCKEKWESGPLEIIIHDGVEVGFISVDRSKEEIKLSELVIAPEHQGKGIGSKFLEQLKNEAETIKVNLTLQVLRLNKAVELYKRHGFEVVGENETHLIMIFCKMSKST